MLMMKTVGHVGHLKYFENPTEWPGLVVLVLMMKTVGHLRCFEHPAAWPGEFSLKTGRQLVDFEQLEKCMQSDESLGR